MTANWPATWLVGCRVGDTMSILSNSNALPLSIKPRCRAQQVGTVLEFLSVGHRIDDWLLPHLRKNVFAEAFTERSCRICSPGRDVEVNHPLEAGKAFAVMNGTKDVTTTYIQRSSNADINKHAWGEGGTNTIRGGAHRNTNVARRYPHPQR